MIDEEKTSWVYVFKNAKTGLHKIGRSVDPWQRARNISTASGTAVDFLFAVELFDADPTNNAKAQEAKLHKMLGAKRISGEWFRLTKSDVSRVYEHLSNLDVECDFVDLQMTAR